MKIASEDPVNIFGATLTRRRFIKVGGILSVSMGIVRPAFPNALDMGAGFKNALDPTLPSSWIEIHPDNTILIRTGKSDFGQSTPFTAFPQIVAEEMSASFEAIKTVIAGDTDRTPDGGGAFDFLGRGWPLWLIGMPNLRKAAAYTYQALLELASARLGVPKIELSVKDGVVSGGGKSISYGDLVKDQQLKLTIPVTGNLTSKRGLIITGDPPMKPVSQYTIIGKSYKNAATMEKVTARAQWATDVRLAGMLHARVVHPKTLGSTLVSVGELDTNHFPNARVIVKGNLVGVVAPTEWEAIRAAQQVAAATKWTDWKGLPGNANLFTYLRQDADWNTTPVTKSDKSRGEVTLAMAGATKKLMATYEFPYRNHAPIGPAMALADAQSGGTIYIHTHNQNPQSLRRQIAQMLGVTVDRVVVRIYAGPGDYGRSNGGNAGANDEAVILSMALGRPVRVQWTRADDLQWSTQSPAAFADVEIALDAKGKIAAYQVDHYMPAGQDDRGVGALLAGLPTMAAPDEKADFDSGVTTINRVFDPWLYDGVAVLMERGHGTFQIGQKESPLAVGIRDHEMRTPAQSQQNFPRELAISEAAALAVADAIQFRIDHATDDRVIGVLKAVREASGWETRPSPVSNPLSTGKDPARGRGVSVMLRHGTYWACVCEIAVIPETGAIRVEKYTVAVDPGVVINPMQLKRQVEGGAVMGICHALLEEAKFDESAITSRDWWTYPILKMSDVPAIKVVLLNRPEVGVYGGGSEAANALAAPAIAAALFDATGKIARRLPLKPEYVQSVLKA